MTRSIRCLALAGLLCVGAAAAEQSAVPLGNTQALLAQGRPDDAMRSLEARVGTNPFDAVSMNNLAAVKASRQDWYGAADLLVRAHRLAPDNGVIGSNLSQLNEYLASRAAPGKVAATSSPTEGAIWPEPPQLWQVASGPAAQARVAASGEASSTGSGGTSVPRKRKHRSAPAAASCCQELPTPAAVSPGH
ncbi:MAG: tetratricopeptide repeat protein [Nevskia sp.]|nr:tetratricopeptide repeat protein [Nevskia sp.]